jgi:TFIIF-interacting CTD phosphatase-like protein
LPESGQEQLLPDTEPELSTAPTLVLDLDETLIHTVVDPVRNVATTHERPGLRRFLKSAAERFEIVIFTAGLQQHASPLIDKLDPEGLVKHRLYRQHTRRIENHSIMIKDLARLNRPLSRTVIVDNRCQACLLRRMAARVQ